MRLRHLLMINAAVVALGAFVLVTGIFTVRGDPSTLLRTGPSPPFPDWTIQHSSINPECNWGEALELKWEVNPSHFSITTVAIMRDGTHLTNFTDQDPCLGTEGMTCQFTQTLAGQPDKAWGRVEVEAEGGVVALAGECR
jgi:hypothetical protein